MLGSRTEAAIHVAQAKPTGAAGYAHRKAPSRPAREAAGEGAPGGRFSVPSLRVTFITTARLAGQSNDFIKNQTKQKTDAMISRYSRLDDIIS